MSLEHYGTNGAVATREQTVAYFPNLASLHEDTQFWAYREFRPMHDKVEITLYWREPGKKKFRLDAELEGKYLTENLVVGPEHIRLVSLVSATEAVQA